MNRKKHIVYDVDDVLNNLNQRVMESVNVPLESITHYNINENGLSANVIDQILLKYADPDVFSHLDLMPGGEHITDVEKTGNALVHIHSNNFSEGVIKAKSAWLYQKIPDLNKERINLLLVDGKSPKVPATYADIIVEDCLANLLLYGSNVIKILINKTYNQFETYGINSNDTNIIRVKSLIEANHLVNEFVNAA